MARRKDVFDGFDGTVILGLSLEKASLPPCLKCLEQPTHRPRLQLVGLPLKYQVFRSVCCTTQIVVGSYAHDSGMLAN